MNNKRRLWQIFGPVLCAFILLLLVFLTPWKHRSSTADLYEAANSRNVTVFKGVKLKQQAFAGKYVPFYGSSELSRLDPLHPSVLAAKYHRHYRPFLLGGAGSQSLAHFIGMQGTSKQLTDKKAVVIVSPQWFSKRGQDVNAFSMYYSPLQAAMFLLKARNTEADRYAASRVASMPTVKDGIIKDCMKKIAAGKPLSSWDRFWLENREQMLLNEDQFFNSFQLHNHIPRIKEQEKLLPKKYSPKALKKVADQQGALNTNSNNLGIDNTFYRTRLPRKVLKGLKGKQKHFNYLKSTEYSDFELLLNQFAKQHTNVLFIITPVNDKWAKYTGLSQKMYQKSVVKIKHQLRSQGFNNITDLSRDGGKPYFMHDTIHIGWNGWLAVDRAVKPFLAQKNRACTYLLNNYYYSKNWRDKTNNKFKHFKYAERLKEK